MKLKENVDSKKVVDIINRVNQEIADKKLGIITKTFYRVSHPSHCFSPSYFETLAEAENHISVTAYHIGESAEYWKKHASELYIERVTQKAERVK
tara:strand:+ start:1147 stop:1431 length:285 start_codon:yes stop_codon:yes gene_type:complete